VMAFGRFSAKKLMIFGGNMGFLAKKLIGSPETHQFCHREV
jgi:hypothetical protein